MRSVVASKASRMLDLLALSRGFFFIAIINSAFKITVMGEAIALMTALKIITACVE